MSTTLRVMTAAGIWLGAALVALYVLSQPPAGHAAATGAGLVLVTAITGALGTLLSLSTERLRARRRSHRVLLATLVAAAPIALFFGALGIFEEPIAAIAMVTPVAVGASLVALLADWILYPRTPSQAKSAT